MRTLLIAAGFVCMFITGAWAAKSAQVSFTGTWLLDHEKSDVKLHHPAPARMPIITLVVAQDDKQITVERRLDPGAGKIMGPESFTYRLDGVETTADAKYPPGSKATLSARWLSDRKTLELTKALRRTGSEGRQGIITQIDQWSLSDDGRALTIIGHEENMAGKVERKLVFNRK
jgi:hypothetical protein